MSDLPPPPPGFKLDTLPPPPPGFKLDGAAGVSSGATGLPSVDNGRSSAGGDLEALTHLVTGGAAGIAGGMSAAGSHLENAGRFFLNLLGAKLPAVDPLANAEKVQGDLTYEPRTEQGKNAVAAVGAPLQAVQGAADTVAEKAADIPVAGPALATAAHLAPGAAAAVIAPAIGKALAPEAEAAVAPAARAAQTPLELARSAGFKVRPSDVQAANPTMDVPGLKREGLIGSDSLQKELRLHNAARATQLGAEQIGAPNPAKITDADITTAQKPHAAVYDATGTTVGSFKPSDTLASDLQQLTVPDPKSSMTAKARARIDQLAAMAQSGEMAGPQVVKDISWLRSQKARPAADALEDELERQLQAKAPDQVQDFRDARKGFAQTYDVQKALKSGQIDMSVLKRIDKATQGKRLTGNLKLLATVADELGGSATTPKGGIGTNPLPSTRSFAGMVHHGVGALAKKIPGVDVGSDRFQNKFGGVGSPTEQSYHADLGKRSLGEFPGEAAAPDLSLTAPSGTVGIRPTQGSLELPPGREPAPPLDLAHALGEVGVRPTQGSLELPPGRDDFALQSQGGEYSPYQHSLLPAEVAKIRKALKKREK